jgi:hypothetical protein
MAEKGKSHFVYNPSDPRYVNKSLVKASPEPVVERVKELSPEEQFALICQRVASLEKEVRELKMSIYDNRKTTKVEHST